MSFTRLLLNLRYRLLTRHKGVWLYERLNRVKNKLYGRHIRLDASSMCQLKCLACPTSSGYNKKHVVGWGHLAFHNFKNLIDDNPDIHTIELSNWGEIFLNPELAAIIEYAHRAGVTLRANNGVNFNSVEDDAILAMVKYRFHSLTFSIDGASQETYAKYRVNGNFNRVIENLRRLCRCKKEYGSSFPRLYWQFIIFGHNEHELPRARRMAEALGMNFKPRLNHTPAVSPVKDKEFVRRESGLGVASREEYNTQNTAAYSFPCGQLLEAPQINWDGRLLGCCANKWGHFGNVFSKGLRPVLDGPRVRHALEMIAGIKPPDPSVPCYKCRHFWRINSARGKIPEPMKGKI